MAGMRSCAGGTQRGAAPSSGISSSWATGPRASPSLSKPTARPWRRRWRCKLRARPSICARASVPFGTMQTQPPSASWQRAAPPRQSCNAKQHASTGYRMSTSSTFAHALSQAGPGRGGDRQSIRRVTVDLFATESNARAARYFSRYSEPLRSAPSAVTGIVRGHRQEAPAAVLKLRGPRGPAPASRGQALP